MSVNSSPQTKKGGICTDYAVKSPHVRANCDLKCAPSSGRIDSGEGRPIGVVGQNMRSAHISLPATGQKSEVMRFSSAIGKVVK